MPTRGTVSIETFLCLLNRLDGYPSVFNPVFRKPVDVARNELAKYAREIDPDSLSFEPRYCLWLDDDIWWPKGHVDRAVRILEEHPDVDMVSGVLCGRNPFQAPAGFVLGERPCATLDELLKTRYDPEQYKDGELTPLSMGSVAWALMRRDLLDRVGDNPSLVFRASNYYRTTQP